jgi:hypothetical protein
MAQAEHITTAIRELMSRGQPLKSTNRVRAAHTEFALAGNALIRSIPASMWTTWTPAPGIWRICLAARVSRRPQRRHGPEQTSGEPNRRLYRSLVLKFRPSSTSRRSASERDGLSGCLRAHASTLSLSAGESRIGIVSP